MTIRLLCDARGKHRRDFMNRTLEMSAGEIELGLHFGHSEADYHAPALHRVKYRGAKRGNLMDRVTHHKSANRALLESDDFRQKLETFIDQMHRLGPTYHYRSHNLANLQDYIDYLHILSDAMAQQMEEEGITHALFYTIPHLAYDTLLYEVARSLGIKTLVLSQTLFPGQFFSMERISDYGSFNFDGVEAEPYLIDKGSAPEFFYMNDKWQQEGKTGTVPPLAVFTFLKHVFRKSPGLLLHPGKMMKGYARMRDIYHAFPDWRDPFSRFFHMNELAYFEHLAEFERAEVDLQKKFIYVPLQNQPEMSTSALGGKYRDQLLMLEALAADLPKDWLIYVKENPRQGSFARGPMFWHRLMRIPQVRFMPSNASTHALSDHAQIVACVTSNAGWEAIRKGRPALVFGNSWYKSLPGVHRYEPGLDFEAIAKSTFLHEDLEKAAGAVLSRAHPGVIEQVYLEIAEKHDVAANLETVGRTTLELLRGERPVTFGALRRRVSPCEADSGSISVPEWDRPER